MRNARLLRVLFTFIVIVLPLLPAAADDVTISGAVSFAALDGSALDHDGTANGVFTVSDGDLSILGTIQCNDVVSTNACAMAFSASGSIVLQPGAALYAENRTGGGSGGNISLDAGEAVVVSGASPTLPGAIISSGNEDTAASSAGGAIFIHAGTTALLGSGSIVSAAAKGGPAGSVTVIAEDAISAAGLIAAGPSSQLTSTPHTLAILSGGSSTHGGGNITLLSHSHSEPAITIASTATIVSQGGSGAAGVVVLEGCGINVNGLVASLSQSGTNAKVVVRSGTSIAVDGRDLGSQGTRSGMLRADALQQSAAGYSVNLFARESVTVHGPATGSLYALNSNGGTTSKDASGTINVMSTASTVTASGNVAAATNGDSGDQGGNVNVSAMFDVTLDSARLDASGDQSTNNPDRAGGTIDVRSYSGRLSWQNGSGDVRPVGSDSGIASSRQGVIRLTYCTTIVTAGTTFATNGASVGAFPTISQSCSPAGPALPPGETHPDCNDPALAADDSYVVDEGGTLNVAAPGVLGNDVDPDGDALTATLVSGPSNASSFTFNADGSFVYVHDGSETTSDSFTYVANDGSIDSNTATVHITVTPVNDAPVANDDSYAAAEAGTINYAAPGVLSNDTDSDGPAMTAVLETGPAHASSFTLNADGSFIYVHDGSETTSDSFTYHATDGALDSNVATASITITPVNDAPVANDDSSSIDEGGSLNGTSVLSNDTDAENDALTASLVAGPANAASFTLNADGTFIYVHDGSETTTDSFTYQANDGTAASNTATVSIAIVAVNDAPVANDDTASVDEGGSLSGTSVLANDTDPENDALSASLVSGPANAASFTLNADGTFSYVHDGSETTSDSFTYVANDGAADSNVATVSITINAINDAPVANDDAASVDEGGTLNGSSVLANDTDAESDTLTAVIVSGPANASSFALNADGTYTYTHDGSETTTDSFTYRANDGVADSNVASVAITISGVNDAPIANDDSISVAEGGTASGTSVLANDTDVENDALTAILVSGPSHSSAFTLNADGTYSYTHDGSETTADSFTYKANDGAADSNVATVTITVSPVNDPPVAVADAYAVDEGAALNIGAVGVLANDTDAENDPLTAVLVTGPAHAASFALNSDGSFSYVHNGTETSTDSFTYKASDGSSESSVTTVTITINAVNDAPSATDDAYSASFHGTVNIAAPGVLMNDSDPEGSALSATLVSSPANGTLTFNADGSFSYTHTGTTLGSDSFTYTAGDGSADSNVATVTISIVNEAPTTTADSYLAIGNTELRVGTGSGLTPAAVVSGSVLANDNDVDGGPAALSISGYDATSTAGGSVAMNPDGTFSYLPPTGYSGGDSFGYTVSDGQATANGLVTINVAERVWYVNSAASGAQSGRSNDPFLTLGQAQGASAANDFIHVAAGAQATGILLKNGQRLIGSGVPLVVGPYTLAGQTARPTLGSTVILASGNVAAGLNVGGIGAGITAGSVNSGTVAEVGVTGAGDGITLTGSTGSFSISDVSLTPGGRGLVISGGSASVSASNLDIVTTGWSGIAGNAGSLSITAGSDGSTVTTTGATAVDLSNMSLAVSLLSINANGSANGIALTGTTGSFAVTGAGTAGTGGTIQNTSARGASLLHTGSISLSHVNFTNNASTNGSVAGVCGDTFNGTNLGCNAAIHLVGASAVALDDVNVSGSGQIGINGNNVANVTMNGVSVTNAGNEPLEHGVQFVNLTGTNSVTNSSFTSNFYRQFTVQNNTGTMSVSVTGSTISSNGLASGAQGMLISGHGTANVTVNVQTSTFSNNFGAGYFSDGGDSAALNVTVGNSTFTSNNVGTNLAVTGGASLTYEISGNNISGGTGPGINIFKGGLSSGTVSGKVIGNTVGTAGVPNSACGSSSCEAIGLSAAGSGSYIALVSNNIVRNFRTRAIGASMSEAVAANLSITANDIAEPAVGVSNAIFMQSGSLSTHTTSVCGDIQSNVISGTYGASGAILVRNRFPTTTFRLPGYAGAGTSTSDVATFLSAQNGGVTAVATLNGNTFDGGTACIAP